MALDRDQVAAALPAYEIGVELGRGSAGVVLAGRHLRLSRDVAIKLLSPELADDPAVRRRFVTEAQVLASFSHPHIVPVYDFVEEEGLCALVLERVGGATLFDHARAGVDPPAACAAALALCSALQYAHERDVLHRDVKPANVLIADSGAVKVTDFGIAKVLGGSMTHATQTGMILGTPAYMAPEQAEGESGVDARTDVYAAGTVLYELLAGRLPYDRESSALQMLYSRVHADPLPLADAVPGVPAQLSAAVMRALARDPAQRQQSAAELASGIAAASTAAWGPDWIAGAPYEVSAPSGTPPPTLTEPPPAERSAGHSGGRRRALLAGAAAAAAMAFAGAAIAVFGGDDEQPPSGEMPGAERVAVPVGKSDWEALPASDHARQQMPGTVLFGTAWMLGGLRDSVRGTVATSDVEGLDTAIDSWQAGPRLPVALHHAMAVTYRDELIVIGGWIPKGADLTAVSSRRAFALRGEKWVELPRMRAGRAAGVAAVVGDTIVVASGQAGNRLVAGTEVFDGRRWRAGAPIPEPREHAAGATDGRYLYVAGGRDLAPDKNTARVERYDPAADRWERLPDMPTPRGGLGAAFAGGRLYAVGGETPTTVLRTVEAYDVASGEWSARSPLRTPRHGMTVVAVGGRLYALGGGLRPGHTNSTDSGESLTLDG